MGGLPSQLFKLCQCEQLKQLILQPASSTPRQLAQFPRGRQAGSWPPAGSHTNLTIVPNPPGRNKYAVLSDSLVLTPASVRATCKTRPLHSLHTYAVGHEQKGRHPLCGHSEIGKTCCSQVTGTKLSGQWCQPLWIF